jgi:small subunit ribosomal protein S1
VLNGTVVSVREDGVFVDIGRKAEAFLPFDNSRRAQPSDEPSDLKKGDAIHVSITGYSPEGYLTLSQVIAERPKNWEQFELAFSQGAAVAGKVTGVVKGGLSVDIGVRAFLPQSRSGIRDSAELPALVGEEIRCRIIQLDVEDENVIVDRRVLLEEEQGQRRQERIAGLSPGMVVKGVVRNIRDFGAFVDIGGVDGLLHISDLAWSKVKDVASVLSEGQELEVQVLKVEQDGKRISVGLKQLTPDPWTQIAGKLNIGDRIKGVVTRLKDFGAFVELEPGIEGLVHVSEMSWARKVRHPSDMLKEGDVVEVVVLEVKAGERRIGLGLKQALGDPWERAEKELQPGTVVEGTIRNIANFGAFVEVLEGVEGLIHVSDITAEKRINHPNEVLKTGQKLKAVVLEMDRDKRRLKLGLKQLEPDERDDFISSCKVGDTVTGRVAKVSGRKAFIELGEHVEGVCSLDDLPAASAPSETEPQATAKDVASLSEMLQAAWKSGSGGSKSRAASQGAKLEKGEVRSFRVTTLDPKSKSIEVTLA